MKYADRITFDPGNATHEEILKDFPFLEREDILASLEYAAEQVNHPVLVAA